MAIIPYLYYEDLGAALKWLTKAFGFEPHGARRTDPDGTLRHAAMKLGDNLVMMGYPGPYYRSPRRLGQTTQCLYLHVGDLDAHFRRARKAGASIVEAPAEAQNGDRRYGAVDPEGHEWYFAQAQTKATAQTKTKTTAKTKTRGVDTANRRVKRSGLSPGAPRGRGPRSRRRRGRSARCAAPAR